MNAEEEKEETPKKGKSALTKKIIKIMTVIAYASGVSSAGFLLSLYYIIFWDPQITGVRPPGYLQAGQMVGLPQALVASDHQMVGQPQALVASNYQIVDQPQAVVVSNHQTVGQPQALVASNQEIVDKPQALVASNHEMVDQPEVVVASNQEIVDQPQVVVTSTQEMTDQPQALVASNKETDQPQVLLVSNKEMVDQSQALVASNQKMVDQPQAVVASNYQMEDQPQAVVASNQKMVDQPQALLTSNLVVFKKDKPSSYSHKVSKEFMDILFKNFTGEEIAAASDLREGQPTPKVLPVFKDGYDGAPAAHFTPTQPLPAHRFESSQVVNTDAILGHSLHQS
ncbi:hypothetical protein OTU49_015884, partial [Cherax quadricarinatus]